MVDLLLQGEKCADAATLSILYNIEKRLEQREENSVWGPVKMSPKNQPGPSADNTCTTNQPKNRTCDTFYGSVFSEENDNRSTDRRKGSCSFKHELRYPQYKQVKSFTKKGEDIDAPDSKLPESAIKDHLKKSTADSDEDKFLKESGSDNDAREQHVSEKNDEQKLEKTYDQLHKNSEQEHLTSTEDSESRLAEVGFASDSGAIAPNKHYELIKQPNSTLGITNKEKEGSQTKIFENSKSRECLTEVYEKNKRTRNKKKSQNRRKIEYHTYVCIKVADENNDKRYEITATCLQLSGIKRLYQKLLAILPEVDDSSTKVNFSADALNMILRYVFYKRYNLETVPSPVTHIEALAAAEQWEICNFQKLLKENILKLLTPVNAELVYSHACHFGLKEIARVSKSVIKNDVDLNSQPFKKRQNSSLISISTYVEPSEIGIPFQPVELDFSMSFDKNIQNTFTFKAISGCYTITGFQVQLNEQYLKKNGENLKIKIDYWAKNVSNNCVVDTKRQEKPLRPINIVSFRENLTIRPNEIGEITVEIDTKPYLCSAYFKKEINVKNKFCLTVDSNFRVTHSDTKLFIIAKLFYHVKKV